MAENSEIAAVGAVYPQFVDDNYSVGDATLLGLQGRQRLAEGLTASVVVGAAPGTFADSPYAGAEFDLQGRLLDEAPITLSLSGGISAIGTPQAEQLNLMAGVQAGLTVSRHLGANLRPYLGARFNPVFGGGGELYPWLTAGGGVSWRPIIAPGTRGLLALEAYASHGWGVSFFDTAATGGEATDLDSWALLLHLGASFGNEHPD
jgi:hypothetical protein